MRKWYGTGQGRVMATVDMVVADLGATKQIKGLVFGMSNTLITGRHVIMHDGGMK